MKKLILIILSLCIALLTVLFTERRFNTRDELLSTDEIMLGFPIPFYKQGVPEIDPPLPWNVGFSFWEFRDFYFLNYLFSFILILIILFSIDWFIKLILNSYYYKT